MRITLGGQGMLHHLASAFTVTTVLIFSSDGNFECPRFVFLLGLGWFSLTFANLSQSLLKCPGYYRNGIEISS